MNNALGTSQQVDMILTPSLNNKTGEFSQAYVRHPKLKPIQDEGVFSAPISKYTELQNVFTLTLSGSPATWQNTLGYPVDIIVTGGSGVSLRISRVPGTFEDFPDKVMLLGNGDTIEITYSSTPTAKGIARIR